MTENKTSLSDINRNYIHGPVSLVKSIVGDVHQGNSFILWADIYVGIANLKTE